MQAAQYRVDLPSSHHSAPTLDLDQQVVILEAPTPVAPAVAADILENLPGQQQATPMERCHPLKPVAQPWFTVRWWGEDGEDLGTGAGVGALTQAEPLAT